MPCSTYRKIPSRNTVLLLTLIALSVTCSPASWAAENATITQMNNRRKADMLLNQVILASSRKACDEAERYFNKLSDFVTQNSVENIQVEAAARSIAQCRGVSGLTGVSSYANKLLGREDTPLTLAMNLALTSQAHFKNGECPEGLAAYNSFIGKAEANNLNGYISISLIKTQLADMVENCKETDPSLSLAKEEAIKLALQAEGEARDGVCDTAKATLVKAWDIVRRYRMSIQSVTSALVQATESVTVCTPATSTQQTTSLEQNNSLSGELYPSRTAAATDQPQTVNYGDCVAGTTLHAANTSWTEPCVTSNGQTGCMLYYCSPGSQVGTIKPAFSQCMPASACP